jgi:hypothetical protein
MARNDTTDTVPDEAIQRWHEAIVAAVNDASDFEIHADNSILEDESAPADVAATTDSDNDKEAQTDTQTQTNTHAQTDDEVEIDDDDLSSCYAHSSCYPESLVDDEDAVHSFRQKLHALATQLHVKFEDIGYIRESESIRAFPLTLRNPPEGAIWSDGTRAVLRMNGDLTLNNRRSRGVQIKDQDILPPDSIRQADAATSSSLNHVYFFVQPADGANENVASLQDNQAGDDEAGDLHEPQSPASVTSNTSDSSELSGGTLINGSPIRAGPDSDSDSEDSDDHSFDYYVSNSNYYDDEEEQRRDQWERLDEALLSNLLLEHGVPAPQTLAFDVRWESALKRPYAIQALLPGTQLSKLYRERKEMSLEDRLWLAGEAAELRARLETIQFQGTGKLQADVNQGMTVGRLPLHMSVRADVEQKLDTSGFFRGNAYPRTGRFGPSAPLYYSLYDTMTRAVDDLLFKKMIRLSLDHEPFLRAYLAFKDILLDMEHIGWFSEADKAFSKSVLNHGTIDDKQILVERTGNPSDPWRLTGLMGFDDAEIVPAVLNKRAWSWVWDVHEASEVLPNEDQFGWTHDIDELPVDLPYLTEDDLKVKQRHEDVLIEKLYVPQYGEKAREQYFDDTYGRGRWLRRLFDFVQGEVVYTASKHRFNKLISDWEQFKKNQNIQPRPMEMWKRLPDYIRGREVEKSRPVQPSAPPSSITINDPNAVTSSSLQHVYFFINSQASSSDAPVTTEVPNNTGEPETSTSSSFNHVYFFAEPPASSSSDGQTVIDARNSTKEAISR